MFLQEAGRLPLRHGVDGKGEDRPRGVADHLGAKEVHPLGHQDEVRPRPVRRPEDGPQVAGLLQAQEDEDQGAAPRVTPARLLRGRRKTPRTWAGFSRVETRARALSESSNTSAPPARARSSGRALGPRRRVSRERPGPRALFHLPPPLHEKAAGPLPLLPLLEGGEGLYPGVLRAFNPHGGLL